MGYTFHSRPNNEGEQQVLYKFSYQSKPIIIPTGIHVKKKNFSKIGGQSKSRLAKIEGIILDSIQEAKTRVPPYRPSELKGIIEGRIEGKSVENGLVRLKLKEAWQTRIDYFERAAKDSSKSHNEDSMRVIMSLLSNMYVDEITSDHIAELKRELLIGRSPASVAGYLRDLRATIISVVGRIKSPFAGVPLPRTPKKKNIALSWEEFQLFKVAPLKTKPQELARDMFLFRYYCLGMRIKDQLLLKRSQIVDGRITYTTHKTNKHFDFKLPKECLEIMEKYPNGKYVFPYMNNPGANLKEIVSTMNKTLKRIAKQVGIEKNLTTHSARHTFAFINQDQGLGFLQKAFDHETEKTTQGYVESLTNQDSLMDKFKR